MAFEAPKHPEWKRLLDAMTTQSIDNPDKKLYTYDELEKLAGIDIKSTRGRQQFDKFAQKSEEILNISWANVINVGYRMIEPSEHGTYTLKRVRKSRKQLRRGKHIIDHTPHNKLSPDQLTATLFIAGVVNTVADALKDASRKMVKTAHAIENPKMPVGSIIEECQPKNEPKH